MTATISFSTLSIMDKKKSPKSNLSFYPSLSLEHIQDPNRLYAVPIVGILIKVVILIPVFVEFVFLGIVYFLVSIINSFFVIFTGTYWDSAYRFTLGFMRLTIKLYFFLYGLTNKYPGFDFTINDRFTVDIEKPQSPNRIYAVPFIGWIARIVLLIPFFIWEVILQRASGIGVMASFFPVLFMGKYPESTFELARDYTRVQLASTSYMSGLSDTYPSFSISLNHKTIKIVLIILGVFGNAYQCREFIFKETGERSKRI